MKSMLKARAALLLVVLSAAVAGCAPAKISSLPSPPPQADDVIVTIYRPRSLAYAIRDATFMINEVEVASIGSGQFTRLNVPAGSYVFQQRWPADIQMFKKPIGFDATWAPREKVFYRLLNTGIDIGTSYSPGSISWRLAQVSEAEATRELSSCCAFREPGKTGIFYQK
jgi:hypothetical protein